MREFRELYTKGRSGKGKNIWTKEWEEGVKSFIDGYEMLSSLYSNLEVHWNNYEQIKRDKKSTWLGVWGIIAEVAAFIIGVIVTLWLTQ